jgi:hypothetical protein
VAIDLFDTIAELKELLLKRLFQNCGLWEFTWWDCRLYTLMICLKPASIKAIVISVEFVPETIYIMSWTCWLKAQKRGGGFDEYGGTLVL